MSSDAQLVFVVTYRLMTSVSMQVCGTDVTAVTRLPACKTLFARQPGLASNHPAQHTAIIEQGEQNTLGLSALRKARKLWIRHSPAVSRCVGMSLCNQDQRISLV